MIWVLRLILGYTARWSQFWKLSKIERGGLCADHADKAVFLNAGDAHTVALIAAQNVIAFVVLTHQEPHMTAPLPAKNPDIAH